MAFNIAREFGPEKIIAEKQPLYIEDLKISAKYQIGTCAASAIIGRALKFAARNNLR